MTNTELLEQAIEKSGLKYKAIAAALGITEYGLQQKRNGKTEFKASEIKKMREMLNISPKMAERIFFA